MAHSGGVGAGAWSCNIDSLSRWREGSWMRCAAGGLQGLQLRLHHDLLIISGFDKAYETLNLMSCNMKGYLKGDLMVLGICDGENGARKIKFRFLCSPSQITECVNKMLPYLPIVDSNAKQAIGQQAPPIKFHTIGEAIQKVLDNESGSADKVMLQPMPLQYSDFVRLCLLDPAFPQIVAETQKIINTINDKKTF